MDNREIPVPSNKMQQLQFESIEADSFNLLLKQLKYDSECLEVAKKKLSSWATSVYHAKLRFRTEARKSALQAGEFYFGQITKMHVFSTGEALMKEFDQFITTTSNVLKLQKDANAELFWELVVVVMSWCFILRNNLIMLMRW